MTGKETCKILKKIRKTIADNNGIDYQITECTYEGECLGFCEKCDSEVRYLEAELKKRTDAGQAVHLYGLAYPSFLDSLLEANNTVEVDDNASLMVENAESKGEKVLSMRIEELDFPTRVYNCLIHAGFETVEDLTEKTEHELLTKVRNLGKKSCEEVMRKLHSLGLSLKGEDRCCLGMLATEEEDARLPKADKMFLMGVPAPDVEGEAMPFDDDLLLMGDLDDPELTDDDLLFDDEDEN